MGKSPKTEKWISFCDKAMVFSFCALIYFLPISIALNEIFTGIALLFYLLKRGAMFSIELREQKRLLFLEKIRLFFKIYKPIDNPLNKPIAILLGVSLLSVIFSQYPQTSLIGFLGKVLQSAFIYFNFIECINSRKRLRIFLTVFFISVVLICTNGLFQHFTGQGFIHGQLVYQGRITSSLRQANDFGAYLLLIIPVLFYLFIFLGRKPKKEKDQGLIFLHVWFSRVLIGLLFIASIVCFGFTYSRGAWLSLMLGAIILGMTNRKVLIGFVVLFGLFFLVFYQRLVVARAENMTIKNMNDILGHNNRLGYWERAIAIIKDYPIIGSGVNTYSQVQKKYTIGWGGYPHNSYLQLTAETGFLGLFAFLWMLIILFITAFQSLKKTGPPSSKMLLFGFLTGFFCFLIHSFFDTHFYSVQLSSLMWVIMGLIIAICQVEKKFYRNIE